ncbi:MAG: trypsin-like serine protease [Gemmatimonadaceae bacterium]|nr:trypsin-like serine protease [Gemmatimonadaceae bacterium]
MGDGTTWHAESYIVGVNSTGTIASGGDPRYIAAQPAYSGVVTLIMEYPGGAFICSGSLLPDRKSILTAAHCVSSGPDSPRPLRTTVYFPNANADGVPYAFDTDRTASRTVTVYNVNRAYTGEVIDQNDIAVLQMDSEAPASATAYDLYTASDIEGGVFNVAGYGGRSNAGGTVGANLGTGRLRQGQNRYDFRFGDSDFGGFFTDRDAAGENFFGTAEVEYSYVSDFDSGFAVNDQSCRLAVGGFGIADPKYCDLGTGLDEVSVAGGDSGGPQFIGGKLASVTSYGLTFGPAFGDYDARLNSSFGELNGFVPVYIHAKFIDATMVPEPATFGLMGAGLAVLGLVARRRRSA